MLSCLTWKWGGLFGPEYVNHLRAGLERHLRLPHEVVCVTDDPTGVDSRVRVVPMVEGHLDMSAGKRACFRRLRMLDRDWALANGFRRVLHLDLDVVLVDDVTPLVDRPDPLVIYDMGLSRKRPGYNPSLMLFDAGVLHDLWLEFDRAPGATWQAAKRAHYSGSDMAVLARHLTPLRPPTWSVADGVMAFWRDVKPYKRLPPGARIVVFHGDDKPGAAVVRRAQPWIAEHWS